MSAFLDEQSTPERNSSMADALMEGGDFERRLLEEDMRRRHKESGMYCCDNGHFFFFVDGGQIFFCLSSSIFFISLSLSFSLAGAGVLVMGGELDYGDRDSRRHRRSRSSRNSRRSSRSGYHNSRVYSEEYSSDRRGNISGYF